MSLVRVLYVHHRPELGGAPTSLAYLIRELDRDRFEPHVYCPPGPATALFYDSGAVVHEGPVAPFTHIWASRYAGWRWLAFGRDLWRLPLHIHRFRQTLGAYSFDVVHLNDSPLVAAAWLAHRRGLRVVWHLRSALPDEGRDVRSRLIRRAIRRFSSASIAINEDVARSFAVDSEVVPNSIDLARFHPGDARAARKTLGLPVERATIAYFGFMYPSKGFEDAVEAVALLTGRGVDATLLIVGGGVRGPSFFNTRRGRAMQALGLVHDHHQRAAERVGTLGLDDSVRLLPFTHEPELVYCASDVVVAPSRGPELGRPVLEAAATGRPVVASGSRDGGGVLTPGETGLLVPPESPPELADTLERLFGDRPFCERLGRRARALAEAEFDPAINARRIMDLYERVLER